MAKKKEAAPPQQRLQEALVPCTDWPYQVPENWCWVKFGTLAKEIADGPFGSNLKREHYTEHPEVRIIQLSNIGENGWREENTKYTTFEHAETISRSIVNPGDLIIAKMMPAGRAIICPNHETKFVLSSDAVKYVPYSQLNSKFILNEINSYYFQQQVQENTQGITRARTSIKKLKEFSFALPPLAEQQRIVERIESLFAQLDEAREKAQTALDSFEPRKAAILHKAFTGELTAKLRNMSSQNDWKIYPLGELSDIVSSKRIYKEEYTDHGIPFFRSSEVVDLYDTGYTTPEFFISEQRYEEIKERYGTPAAGDLLVTSVGTIGKTWIVDNRAFYYKDGNLTQVKQCDSLNMQYLQYFIMSENFKKQVNDTVAGSAYNALTIVKFKKIKIPLPSIAEQLEIVHILDSLLAKEQQAKEAAEAVLDQIDLVKKSILSRAFRGGLATNDPSEESSIELLKQILI